MLLPDRALPLYPGWPDYAARTPCYECDRNAAEAGWWDASKGHGSRMRKNVLGVPALQIELCPRRQKFEARLRQRQAALAREHGIEAFAQGMQMQHVRRSIGQLRLAQDLRAPVARLLLLRQIDVEHLAHQILQAMAVGVGAAEPGGDLGAIPRVRHHAERVIERGEIEAGEIKIFVVFGLVSNAFRFGASA